MLRVRSPRNRELDHSPRFSNGSSDESGRSMAWRADLIDVGETASRPDPEPDNPVDLAAPRTRSTYRGSARRGCPHPSRQQPLIGLLLRAIGSRPAPDLLIPKAGVCPADAVGRRALILVDCKRRLRHLPSDQSDLRVSLARLRNRGGICRVHGRSECDINEGRQRSCHVFLFSVDLADGGNQCRSPN